MVSHLQTCQRAFVRALLAVAAVLRVEAGVSRDSQPDALRHASGKVFRKASKSPHPEGLQDLRAGKKLCCIQVPEVDLLQKMSTPAIVFSPKLFC